MSLSTESHSEIDYGSIRRSSSTVPVIRQRSKLVFENPITSDVSFGISPPNDHKSAFMRTSSASRTLRSERSPELEKGWNDVDMLMDQIGNTKSTSLSSSQQNDRPPKLGPSDRTASLKHLRPIASEETLSMEAPIQRPTFKSQSDPVSPNSRWKFGLKKEKKKETSEKRHLSAALVQQDADDIGYWISKNEKEGVKWESADLQEQEGNPVIDAKCTALGFHIENGTKGQSLQGDSFPLEDTEKDIAYYQNYLSTIEHDNFIGISEASDTMVVSIERGTENHRYLRCIIRNKSGDQRLVITPKKDQTTMPDSADGRLKLLRIAAPKTADFRFSQVKEAQHAEIVEKLLYYEQNQLIKNYKFGIMYVGAGQKEENEYFSNENISPQFEAFLNCLGDRVALRGWTKFTGGLDTRSDATGTSSIYTEHKGFEIMFHVSTMLPFNLKDEQQVERKRHIGNDVVLIVFKESADDVFTPANINSQFNHVWIVVQPENGAFRVSIVNKFGVKPYGPPLPSSPVFQLGPQFREFLLSKLINAERSAMYAPDFRGRMSRARSSWLNGMISLAKGAPQKAGLLRRVSTVAKLGLKKDKIKLLQDDPTPDPAQISKKRLSLDAETATSKINISRQSSKEVGSPLANSSDSAGVSEFDENLS
eukprot:TRINITY_DN3923_c0_g1_i2.p1 TRINITY_DN3923_c0_g1~~TRINITY_DN3923_c0_g1_i2.p1  ORF type:complete len:650 (+),score=151.74 TRINITY_DN3923_c0_g1_i2:227-2176(+)